MRVPRQRMRFTRTDEAHSDPTGFLVIDLKALDLDGVDRLVLPWADLEAVRAQGDKQADESKRVRDMLGG